MQEDTPADPEPEVEMQQDADAPPTPPPGAEKKFSVSVDEIRIRLREVGISKSKDTVQRWCREGLLDCQRLGLMRRYFATEPSVETWLHELTKKENKQAAGAEEDGDTQVHSASSSSNDTRTQVHSASTERDKAIDSDLHEAADNDMQQDAGEGTTVIRLKDEQIEMLKSENIFLREELVDRRSQAEALGDVIKSLRLQSETALLNAQGAADKGAGSVSAEVILNEEEAERGGENHPAGASPDGV